VLAADAAAELEAFAHFYGALAAEQYFGEHVCCAAQPSEANGSVEDIFERGVDAGVDVTARWANEIVEAVSDKSSEGAILTALGSLHFDLAAFEAPVEHALLHGAMLGALDSVWEREHGEEIAPARFSAEAPSLFSSVPFADARALFEKRQVLPKAAFDALEHGAKRQAFTVARMASSEMLNVTKAELGRQLALARQVGKGFNFREFKTFAKEKLESAGWTPASKSHVETIFRTNAVGALASGRFVEMRQPDVLAALPYWQIRGVSDSRTRPTHKAAFGIVLPANSPFWLHAYPPFGYNCRCRVIARTAAWVKRQSVTIGPMPKGLPDPGFDSGTGHLMLPVPDKLLAKPEPKPLAPPSPAHPPWLHAPLPPVLEPPPLPPPLPLPPAPAAVVEPVVLEPAAPPLPPAPPIHVPPATNTAANILGRKLADATGSNPGGVYEGLDGKKRYVKFYTDPAQAVGETVANDIYGALGMGHLESTTFEHGGQLAYASELVPGVKTLQDKGFTPALAKKALDGFAADVLLANWDAAGLTLDNLVVTPKGKVIRIDNGGALLSRAKGGRKPQSALHDVTEWTKFFDPKINPGYAKLAQAAGVTSADELGASLEKGIKKILALKKKSGGWGHFVAEHAGGLAKHEQQQMALMLEERTSFLEQKLAELKKPKPAPGLREWGKLKSGALPKARTQPAPDVTHGVWLRETGQRFRQVVPRDGVAAIESFTGAGFGEIRKAARLTEDEYVQASGAVGTGEKTARDKYRRARAMAESIDRAFVAAAPSAPYSQEAELKEIYRGVGGLSEQVFQKMIAAKEAVFAAPASTSWKVSVAESFADRQGGNKIVFVFRPKEQFAARRLAVDAVSTVGSGEAEVLARAGSSWRVADVVQNADASGPGKFAIVYLDEIEALEEPEGATKLRAPGSSVPLSVLQTS
jgi:SPP1 gp7 family putative phage head morphogenesis protein